MIGQLKLDFWIENEVNVVFRGRNGVGETTMVIDAFNRKKFKWLYFSAGTMDPWVDFIGVPKGTRMQTVATSSSATSLRPRASTRS
jgi:hypothetical protein